MRYPEAKIYEEQYTGTKLDRPIFTKLLREIKENDVLVVSNLDRFVRNTVEGIRVVEDLFRRFIFWILACSKIHQWADSF